MHRFMGSAVFLVVLAFVAPIAIAGDAVLTIEVFTD